MAPAEKPKPKDGDKKKRQVRNYDLGSGVMRFSRSRMYHKKALYKFVGKKVEASKKTVKPRVIEKQVRGEKNGGKRFVLVKKRKNYYPTQDKIRPRPAKQCFKDHKHSLKSSLSPGTVVILLAGSHKGKRVVLLKQLESGLLLVTGPFGINSCPMRRISQRYVIGTQTKIDLSGLKLPENINDEYFRRHRTKRPKKAEGDIFNQKKESYKVSEQRKADQIVVDKQVIEGINKNPDRRLLKRYLYSMFGLHSSQYPHRLKF